MTRSMLRGTKEYLKATVTANVTLDTQVVEMSFDKATWLTATWLSPIGTTRTCGVLLDSTNTPAGRTSPVYVRITDNPEIPEIFAGDLLIT